MPSRHARSFLYPPTGAPREHLGDEVVAWVLRAILVTRAELRIEWDSPLFEELGLAKLERRECSRRDRAKAVRAKLVGVERRLRRSPRPASGLVLENVARLGGLLGLDGVERDLLALAEFSCVLQPLATCFDSSDGLSARARTQALGEILGRGFGEVQQALRPDGNLATLGLLHLGHDVFMREWFSLREGLDSLLLQEHAGDEELLRHFARRSAEPEFPLEAFPHLREVIGLLQAALRGALRTQARGFHVLLHGLAGVGKTQLARALAKSVGSPLFEVAVETAEQTALDRDDRLGAYRVCQRYGERVAGAIALFDEMEDVFRVHPLARLLGAPSPGEDKGFLNRLLEGTPIPTVWCSNRVEGMDPAFLRRFDLVVNVASPPPSVRREMLVRHLDGLGVEPGLLERIAATAGVTPADCQRAARVAALVGPEPGAEAGRVVRQVLDWRLQARGGRGVEARREGPAAYDPRFLNVDVDLGALTSGLLKRRRGTLLLHGRPGTGKSAWVRHLAERLEAPLVLRYGSDLLGKYVGETEKAIAAMFEEARDQHAVLFLDEADSFLGSRDSAQQRWEVSQTNELLVRMEGFDGVFVCATNRLPSLDSACLRRFAIKAEFKVLRPEQALELFEATLGAAGQGVPSGEERALVADALRRLSGLAPGDFAAVHQRALAVGLPFDAEALLAGLASECRLKPGTSGAVGFRQ